MSLIVTLISNPANNLVDSEIALNAKQAIDASSLHWLAPNIACDLEPAPNLSAQQIEQNLRQIIGQVPIDVVIQEKNNRKKEILIADMDSTMIEQECIDELAAHAGIKDKIASITKRAMNGEIEFEDALRARVAMLKGLPITVVKEVIDQRITLMPGGKQLVRTMAKNGAYCALISGGFTCFSEPISQEIGFHSHQANQLLEENGILTGEVKHPILGREAKAQALTKIAQDKNCSVKDAIAVGDGANDLAMLALAGSGVALHAKPIVAAQAKICINHGDLTALLYCQGYQKNEFI